MSQSRTPYIIIKPTRQSGFGRGVRKYKIESQEDAVKSLEEWIGCQNFIVQECVDQHPILASFNESSTNMIRFCSWRHGGEVDILYAAARIGIPGSVTDIAFVNGVEMVRIVGVTKDGYFRNKMIDQDGRTVKELPERIRVPEWDHIVSIIKQNHLLVDNFDIIGWDFCITKENEPVCFEWNIQWPGTVLYQYANGPLWGDDTDAILSFLKNEKNRYNYIPSYMKLK